MLQQLAIPYYVLARQLVQVSRVGCSLTANIAPVSLTLRDTLYWVLDGKFKFC